MPVWPVIPYFREALGALAGAAIVVVLMLVFYEGLPVGPLRHLPVLKEFVQGRVETERQKARDGYVQEARLIAAEAKLAERERQLAAGRKALDGFADLLRDARLREEQQAAIDEAEDREYEAKLAAAGRSCRLDQSDIDWLRR